MIIWPMRAAFLLALVSLSFGATAPPPVLRPVHKPSTPPVKVEGKPYSGELRSEASLIRPDGTRIADSYLLRAEYRDSAGRTRREEGGTPCSYCATLPKGDDPRRIITIDDPVAGVEYVLDPNKKIAHRFTYESMTPHRQIEVVGMMPKETTRTEVLGSRVIDGVAGGRRARDPDG